MRAIQRRPAASLRRSLRDRRTLRSSLGRVSGLFLVLAVVGLPLFSNHPVTLVVWDDVAESGFAASTGWRFVGPGPQPGTVLLDLVSVVGQNTLGSNQYEFHESTNFQFDQVVSNTVATGVFTSTVVITDYARVAAGSGACCAAPNVICNGDGTCTTAFRGADGRFRELTIVNNVASSVIIDPAANNQLSATIDAVAGALVAASSDTVANTLEIYLKPEGATNYTQVATPPCDPPTSGNLHWATTSDPFDDWLITGCRNATNVNLRQFTLPAGTQNWSVNVTAVGAVPNFSYIQLDPCGELEFPDQSMGPGVAYAVPRSTDTVVGITGPVGGTSAPIFDSSTTLIGSVGDYYALICDGDKVTLVRADDDGNGLETVHFDFDQLSGDTNQMTGSDEAWDPAWVNSAPDYAGTITNEGSPDQPALVNTPYLPIILKHGGFGGQVVYGTLPRILFFDGFESGDTSFWDNTVGLASEDQGPGSGGPAAASVASSASSSPRPR